MRLVSTSFVSMSTRGRVLLRAACILCCALGLLLPSYATTLLQTNFAKNPADDGWHGIMRSRIGRNIRWRDDLKVSEGHALEVMKGCVASPRFPFTSRQYCRVSFLAKTSIKAMVALFYYDDAGKLLPSDNYNGFDGSPGWTRRTLCFRAKPSSVMAAVVLDSSDNAVPMLIADITVESVSAAEVDQWMRAEKHQLPPFLISQRNQGGKYLPKTLARLQQGEPVTIACLGDSIANDLSNGLLELYLQRLYPNANVEIGFVGRGATGFAFFQRPEQMQQRVFAHPPDLLILEAISNKDKATLDAALQSIIEQTRRALPNTEILLVSPHMDKSISGFWGSRQRAVLHAVAKRNGLGMVDLLSAWNDYLAFTGHDEEWLRRDPTHMNVRGKLLSAAVVVAFIGMAK